MPKVSSISFRRHSSTTSFLAIIVSEAIGLEFLIIFCREAILSTQEEAGHKLSNTEKLTKELKEYLTPNFLVFAVTIFVSALLVFQVQPIVARYILPWFGGSPSVWSTCMLFFQIGLLSGYAYAHALSRFLNTSTQVKFHITLLALSLLWLPIAPSEAGIDITSVQSPVWSIIKILFSSVGLPYILLSSTGPLLQHWFSERFPKRSPYRLYSLSNVGSIIGLLIYPFLIEPNFGLGVQTTIWEVSYGLAIICCASAGWSLYSYNKAKNANTSSHESESTSKSTDLKVFDPFLWMLLAACGSILLLAATNFICQDVAVIPFMWIIPLCLYLVTFTIAFDNPRWYLRWIWLPALFIIIQPLFEQLGAHYDFDGPDLLQGTIIYLSAMFIATMVCHGELARIKPHTRHLTLFYLMISLGGALGGCFVSLVAPHVFSDYWEWPLGFALCLILSAISYWRSPGFGLEPKKHESLSSSLSNMSSSRYILVLFIIQAIYFGSKVFNFSESFSDSVIASHRNFYGVIRVAEEGIGGSRHRRELLHGNIDHGTQLQSPRKKMIATTYYSRKSGVGTAILHHPNKAKGTALSMGVVGLGAGTLATYLTPKDKMVFYEINPVVEKFAKTHFTFLSAKNDGVQVVLGDARISLARELRTDKKRNFDVLAVDAFSGDAIPIHLLTKEAFALYFEHLKEDGILAVHISNKHFNLKPLIYHMGKTFNYTPLLIKNQKASYLAIRGASWVLLTKNQSFINNKDVKERVSKWDKYTKETKIVWTDDYSNVVQLLDD